MYQINQRASFVLFSIFTLAILQFPLAQTEPIPGWIPLPGLGTVPTTTTTTTKQTTGGAAATTQPTTGPRAPDAFNTGFEARAKEYRRIHSAEPLVFSAALQAKAKICADNYASPAPLQCADSYQDYIANWEDALPDLGILGGDLANAWYSEGESQNYDYDTPTYQDSTTHFTQLVWKSTKNYGCATSDTTVSPVFISCYFEPWGNVETTKGSGTACVAGDLPPTTSLKANVLPEI